MGSSTINPSFYPALYPVVWWGSAKHAFSRVSNHLVVGFIICTDWSAE